MTRYGHGNKIIQTKGFVHVQTCICSEISQVGADRIVPFNPKQSGCPCSASCGMVRLSASGKRTTETAEMWDVTVATVLRTIRNFNSDGLKSLADKPRKGRARKTTNQYVSLLKEAVQKSPRDFGYPFSSWTLNRLREHLGRKTGTLLNPCYLSGLMAREGIVYRRPKHVMAHLRSAKDYNEKRAVLEFLKTRCRKASPL